MMKFGGGPQSNPGARDAGRSGAEARAAGGAGLGAEARAAADVEAGVSLGADAFFAVVLAFLASTLALFARNASARPH